VAKPEWGSKRVCLRCSVHYYDLRKPLEEIVCPQCGARFDPERVMKRARIRIAAPEKQVEPAAPDEVGEEDVAATEGDLIEDAAELSDDEEVVPGKSKDQHES
jgi:uncharacterized protein (TIGR02300 family)